MFIIGGLAALLIGGEALLRGAVGIARRFHISEMVIGLTLVGFGTSVPELVTSLRAVDAGAVGISVGNVAGSNVANVLLVIGIAALIKPIITSPTALARDFSFMAAVTLAFCMLVYFDLFSRVAGVAMLIVLAAYVLASLLLDRRKGPAAELHAEEGGSITAPTGLGLCLVMAVFGAAAVVIGARWLVDGGIALASAAGVSEAVIGLTIVAIGTSLPEVATSAVSAFRGKSDVALGNIIGSNIFNVLGILGVTAIVHPFSVLRFSAADDPGVAFENQGELVNILSRTDIGAVVLSVALMYLFAFSGKKIARWEGGVLLLAYGLYLFLILR
ncbi:MAG: calcium/sodium antiporter [Pseudomonadota bacterium]